MFTSTHKSLAVITLLGLSTVFLGFSWSMIDLAAGGSGPTIAAPDSADHGQEILVEASSDNPGLRVVVTDANGNEIYDSDEDPGANEQPAADGGGTLTSSVHIPEDAEGPLTITAQDDSGAVTTKTGTLSPS